MSLIIGAVTRAKLEAWLETYRPELALYERDRWTRGFYRRDSTPRADFRNCGATWRDVAAQLGAIEVTDEPRGGSRPKVRPDDARGGARARRREDDARGGARKGSGPHPVKPLERALKIVEQRIARLDDRVFYAERLRLFRELDRLHERLEIKLVEAPDYPDRQDDE